MQSEFGERCGSDAKGKKGFALHAMHWHSPSAAAAAPSSVPTGSVLCGARLRSHCMHYPATPASHARSCLMSYTIRILRDACGLARVSTMLLPASGSF